MLWSLGPPPFWGSNGLVCLPRLQHLGPLGDLRELRKTVRQAQPRG